LSFDFEKESFRIAFRSVRERKMRSSLTVVGIAIGIAAIISLVSIGEGTNKYISEQFEEFGANKIIITPQSFGARPAATSESLSKKDIDLIENIRGVEDTVEIYFKTLPASYKDQNTQLSVIGIDGDKAEKFFSDMQSFELENGRFFKSSDKNVVVVGNLVANSIFEDDIKVRDKVIIKDEDFTVIGILKEIGNSQDDAQIMVPLGSLRKLTGEDDEISYIMASAIDNNEVEEVADDIQDELDDKYGEDTFMVLSTAQLAGQISTITSTLSAILGGVAGIALLVAGVGISNTMYMSILERTKEIGIMKSIGATGINIMEIFLMEASIIGIIGGATGILFGVGLSKAIGIALDSYGVGLKTHVTLNLMALGMLFSVGVGVLAGFLPARRAAELDPVEALRYE